MAQNAKLYWHVSSNVYDFAATEKEVKVLETVTHAEVLSFYQNNVIKGGKFVSLVQSVAKHGSHVKAGGDFIRDVFAYKNGLEFGKSGTPLADLPLDLNTKL